MKIDDYKRLFEIKYEGGWLDDNIWYAKCRICGTLIFDKYLIKNWNVLDSEQIKKRFYAAIRHHINAYHHELIIPKLPKKVKMPKHVLNKEQDIALINSLHFLKNFPFRPYIKDEPLKMWKPGAIVLPHSGKEKKKSDHEL